MPAERQRFSAVEILDASRRLARLIDDLLSVSRGDGRHAHPADQAPGEPAVVWGRPRQGRANIDQPGRECDQILPGGGEVLVTVDQDGDTVQLSVRDQEIGMSPRDMGQLFEKSYRVDRDEVRRAGGTGLGLYTTKRLVEMHGGRLWAESWPGAGSVFRLTLPTTSDELAGSGR
jgi:signal transduction histidine kinase